MSRERVMALCFLAGSLCFLVAPVSAYASAVGPRADAITLFVGSIPFTIGGALQAWLSLGDRRGSRTQRALWWSAAIQFVGTVSFNLTTYRGIDLTPHDHRYDALVWRPDAVGSACFLLSGVILYLSCPRVGWRLLRGDRGWREPAVNLLGCVLFAVSAVSGFAQPRSGSLISPRITDWTTSLGAVCFLGCALGTLIGGRTVKSLRLCSLERDLSREVAEVVSILEPRAQRSHSRT